MGLFQVTSAYDPAGATLKLIAAKITVLLRRLRCEEGAAASQQTSSRIHRTRRIADLLGSTEWLETIARQGSRSAGRRILDSVRTSTVSSAARATEGHHRVRPDTAHPFPPSAGPSAAPCQALSIRQLRAFFS